MYLFSFDKCLFTPSVDDYQTFILILHLLCIKTVLPMKYCFQSFAAGSTPLCGWGFSSADKINVGGNISPIFSSNTEASASVFLENIEEMLKKLTPNMHSGLFSTYKSFNHILMCYPMCLKVWKFSHYLSVSCERGVFNLTLTWKIRTTASKVV